MRFLYPLGLLGLIGVPLLIIIYILRSKYNEQTVASTYLWTLSERFFKRRNPLSGLTGIISLIMQILTVIFATLLIARPVFVVPASASEYCFVLDSTGSMNTENGNTTCDAAANGAASTAAISTASRCRFSAEGRFCGRNVGNLVSCVMRIFSSP